MRLPARPALAVAAALIGSLAVAPAAGAHGGTTLAEGGRGGATIRLQADETTTSSGAAAIDLSTALSGKGTGDGARVTFWIRPAGKDTFRVTAPRDETGVAHADVATANRGDWRDWDVSAIVRLTDGTRLRVSNAEANPPGPDPAATPGGGAQGADGDEAASGTTTGGAAPAPPDTADTAGAAAPVADVTGDEDDGAPGWALPSAMVVLALGLVAALAARRRRSGQA